MGGRLTQDVLYKIYNANEGGFFFSKVFLPEPKRADTFNALGYNKIVYATLENDVIACYKDNLINYFYFLDIVGDGLGASLTHKRTGTDVELVGKNSAGENLRENTFWNDLYNNKIHGIRFFQDDYELNYERIYYHTKDEYKLYYID